MFDNDLKECKCIISADGGVKEKEKQWIVEVSTAAKNCKNLIREIVDTLDLQPNPDKQVIALSIGDPTVYGNLKPSPESIRAVVRSLENGEHNGYAPCVGFEPARAAVAAYSSLPPLAYSAADVILASGCSSALELCITALADPARHQNILVPRPGFPIYRTLAEAIGVRVKYYNLLPNLDWQVDLAHLTAQIDQNTACIVLNNPSNPCGSVYTAQHLRAILSIAAERRLPVIADEIYERIVFAGERFVSAAALGVRVPILVCGGLAKRFLVPGWRLGWILVHDVGGAFRDVRTALTSLSQRTIGSNTVVQGALPALLAETKPEFYAGLISVLEANARLVHERLAGVGGLAAFMPQGTMYMMVGVDLARFPFSGTLEFVTKLMEEESVFCLPGDCFSFPGYLRIVLTVPDNLLEEACQRIGEFCNRYYKQ